MSPTRVFCCSQIDGELEEGDPELLCGAGEAGWVFPVTAKQLLGAQVGASLHWIHGL